MPRNIKLLYKTFASKVRTVNKPIAVTQEMMDSNMPPGGPWQGWVSWGDYLWYHQVLYQIRLSRAKYKITQKTTDLAKVISIMMEEEGLLKFYGGGTPVSRKLGGKVNRIIDDDE